MTGGMIVGGWEYVTAAYVITMLTLGGYLGWVLLRLRERPERPEDGR